MATMREMLPPLSIGLSMLESASVSVDLDHVAFFAVLALTLRLMLPGAHPGKLLLGCLLLAVGTELLQFGIDGRTPRWQDGRDDVLGALLGLAIGMGVQALGRHATRMTVASGWLLVVGIAVLPLQQWTAARVGGYPVRAADLFFAVAIGVRGLAWCSGSAPLRWHGWHGWLVLWGMAMTVALGTTATGATSAQSGAGPWCPVSSPYATTAVAKFAGVGYLALLAALACDVAQDRQWHPRIAWSWLAGAAAASIVASIAVAGFYLLPGTDALAPLFSHYGSLPPGPYPRVQSLFANANMACNYFVVSACVLMATREAGWIDRRIAAGLMGALLLASVATLSPGLGGLVLAVALWHGLDPGAGRTGRRVVVAFGLALALLLFAAMWINPAAPFEEPSVRWQIWREAWANLWRHPWLGSGLAVPVVEVAYLDPSGGLQRLTDAHDTFLNVAVQGGLPALAALAGMSAWLVRAGWRALVALPDEPWAKAWMIAFGCAFLYGGLAGSFEDARHLWVAIGMLAAVHPVSLRAAASKPWKDPQPA